MNKVAKITLGFWVIKICATTLGETGGDFLSMTLNIGYAMSSLLLFSFFLIAVGIQIKLPKFHPTLFWTVILATSTVGTTMSDFLDRTLHLGYMAGALILTTCFLITLTIWYLSEKSLSVDNIQTPKEETFFWIAILFSNTLGTALGDFLADSSGLGFLGSAALIVSLIGLVILAFYFTKINHVILFWIAFVLTRPFGATFGDFLTKPIQAGGLNFGTIGTSIFLVVLLVIMLIYTIRKEKPSLINNQNYCFKNDSINPSSSPSITESTLPTS